MRRIGVVHELPVGYVRWIQAITRGRTDVGVDLRRFVSIRAVEISQKNSSKRGSERRVWRKSILGKTWLFDIAPLPPLVDALTGAGLAKMVCKILRANHLEVTILRTNDLERFSGGPKAPPSP
jgi:hypothetical protein